MLKWWRRWRLRAWTDKLSLRELHYACMRDAGRVDTYSSRMSNLRDRINYAQFKVAYLTALLERETLPEMRALTGGE